MSDVRSVFLKGERLDLRPLQEGDLPLLHAWGSDPELRALTGEASPWSRADAEAFLERVRTDPNRIWFAIVERGVGRMIGECGLLRMFHPWHTTDLSIILGDKTAWGKGFGMEAIRLLLGLAFGELGFHRVSVGVVGSNARALRFYDKAGFRREGIQREGYYRENRYEDFVMMSILEDEYRAHGKGPVG